MSRAIDASWSPMDKDNFEALLADLNDDERLRLYHTRRWLVPPPSSDWEQWWTDNFEGLLGYAQADRVLAIAACRKFRPESLTVRVEASLLNSEVGPGAPVLMNRVAEWLFAHTRVRRLELMVPANDQLLLQSLEGSYWIQEVSYDDGLFCEGRFYDLHLYGLLREEAEM